MSEDGNKTAGLDIYTTLMSKNVWGLHPSTASRSKLVKGSTIVFYLGGKNQTFLGTAKALSEPYLDKSGESDSWYKDPGTFRVDLENVNIWDRPKPIKPLLKKLSFIKNIVSWGAYLQGGVRRIDEEDFLIIENSEDYSHDVTESHDTIAEFLDPIDLAHYDVEPHSLPAPERIKVNDLIDNIEHRWKMPNFQRYFDWKKEDVRSFLESIFKDYYVGAFLLWKADKISPLDLISIEGVNGIADETEFIILDGQQRMTALYYAIKSPDFPLRNSTKKCYFYIDFKKIFDDTDPENIIVVNDAQISELESFNQILFPINEIENYDEWINKFEDYLYESEPAIPHDKVRSLRRLMEKRLKQMWRGFEIPYVVLPKSINLPQVADIFEKINSTGKQLSTFDLLIARLLKYGIPLRHLWEQAIVQSNQIKRYTERSGKAQIYIFQTMSLINHPTSSTKKKDILNIYENLSITDRQEFEALWDDCVLAIEDAIDMLENLRDGFGVKGKNEIPFLTVIPVLAALITTAKKKVNQAECFAKIRQWYWSALFTNSYSSGADTQMTADFVDVSLWFNDDEQIPRIVIEARRGIDNLNLKEITSSGNAVYKGVLSLLALEGAKDFETNLSLEFSRGNDKDHIFPKAQSVGFSKYKPVESVLNMTWLSRETNNRKRAKKPSQYLPEFIKEKYSDDENLFKNVLATHFIDDKAYGYMILDDVENFLDTREFNIKRAIKNRIGMNPGVEEIIRDSPTEAIDQLEALIRSYIDEKFTKLHGIKYWNVAATNGIKQKVREKIIQKNNKHPASAKDVLSGLDLLSFCDIMDYSELFVSQWDLFGADLKSKREVEKHFLHLKDYRNSIKHKRSMNNIERKQGEASYEWIYTTIQYALTLNEDTKALDL